MNYITFTPGWDLTVIVFFAVIIAYSFIIGPNRTLKVIVATYIAILTADGMGNLMDRFFIGEGATIQAFQVAGELEAVALVKILIFIFTLVLIVILGKFEINVARPKAASMNIVLNLSYGFLSAGLTTTAILVYISGVSVFSQDPTTVSQAMSVIYDQSYLVRSILNNANVWVALPALVFVVSSFMGEKE